MLSGSSGTKGTLPYSYADPAHTQPAPIPETQAKTSTWNSWFGNVDVTTITTNTSSIFGISTSPQLSKTEQFLETFGLSRTQRYVAFAICLAAAFFLFMLSMLHLPLVVLRPGKFVVPYCMASLFVLVSFGFLHGFVSYFRHLFSPSKMIYSVWFVLASFGTIYASMTLHSYLLTVIMALVQMAGMMAFVVSYVPGGSTGISFMGSMITSSIKSRFSPNSF